MDISIELNKLIEKIENMKGEIYNREIIHKVFLQEIKPLLSISVKDATVIRIGMAGIKSMTVSTIIRLFLQDINGFCRNFENVVVIVTDISQERYEELITDFQAAVLLAGKVAKDNKDIIPYMLVEHDGSISILGFEDNEEQNKLFQYLHSSKEKITSGELAERESISLATASNRLIRLYEKGLICREQIGPRQYQYYSIC